MSEDKNVILETGNQVIGLGRAFVRLQAGIVPAQTLTPGQVPGGAVASGVVSDFVYFGSNLNDATPAGFAAAFAA